MRKGMLILVGMAAVGAVLFAAFRGEPDEGPRADRTGARSPGPPDPEMPGLPESRAVPLQEGAVPALSGIVLSAEDRLVTGARVTVYRLDGAKVVEPPFARLTSDGAGRFTAHAAPSGPYALEARADGHGPALVILKEYDEEKGTHALLRLAPPAFLEGRVVTERGEPVPGAEVSVRTGQVISRFPGGGLIGRVADCGEAETTTDGSGDFRFEDLPPGIYDLTAKAEGMVEATLYSLRAPGDRVLVPLREGLTIRGVLRWGAADPPADIRLRTEPMEVRAEVKRGTTEAEFTFDPLPPGHYRLKILASGFREALAEIDLLRASVPKRLEIDLVPGPEVVCTVTDADSGDSIEGADVVFTRVESEGRAWRLTEQETVSTDEKGCAATRLTPGRWVARAGLAGWIDVEEALWRRWTGKAGPPPPGMFTVSEETVSVKRRLRRLYRIRGRVLDYDRRPVRAWVTTLAAELHPTRPAPPGLRAPPRGIPMRAGEDGRFTIVGVAPWGIYSVRAFYGRNNHAEATDVAIRDGAREVDVGDLLVSPLVAVPGSPAAPGEESPPESISGRVLDDRGNPLRGAVVTARGKAANTAVDGTFRLENVGSGWAVIRIAARGFAPTLLARFEVHEGEDYRTGDIHLPRHGVRVLGRVLDSARAPIEGARVSIIFFGISEPFVTLTDVAGNYEMEGPSAPQVRIRVTAEAAGFQPGTRTDTLVGDRVVNIVLTRYASLTGQLFFRGDPARRATVTCWVGHLKQSAWRRREVDLDAKGRFVLDRIPPGTWNVRIEAPGYARLELGLKAIGEGKTVDLGKVGLNHGGVITGKVLRPDDEPAPGIVVRIRALELETTAGRDGSYRLERVPAGRHALELRGTNGRSRRIGTFAVEEGRELKMNFRWPR